MSSRDQKDDLARQAALLESFAAASGWTYEVLEDLGSGLNHHKWGPRQLIGRICSGEVSQLVLTHKDRLPAGLQRLRATSPVPTMGA